MNDSISGEFTFRSFLYSLRRMMLLEILGLFEDLFVDFILVDGRAFS